MLTQYFQKSFQIMFYASVEKFMFHKALKKWLKIFKIKFQLQGNCNQGHVFKDTEMMYLTNI